MFFVSCYNHQTISSLQYYKYLRSVNFSQRFVLSFDFYIVGNYGQMRLMQPKLLLQTVFFLKKTLAVAMWFRVLISVWLCVCCRYYGGWAAPNIYILRAAGVVRFGNFRIGGLSGIYKSFDYKLGCFFCLWIVGFWILLNLNGVFVWCRTLWEASLWS